MVSYLQLAHSERHPVTGVPSAKVIHNFGRAETVDRDALARLVASISRFLDPEQAIAAAHAGEIEVLDSRRFGGAWVLDQLWERLGIGAALRRVAAGRRLDGERGRAGAVRAGGAAGAGAGQQAGRHPVGGRAGRDRATVPGSATTPRTRRWTSCWTRWTRSRRGSSTRSRTCSTSTSTSSSSTPPPPTGRSTAPTSWPTCSPNRRPTTAVGKAAEGGARRFGKSKDHRDDLPQVVIAMAVTRDGIPVRCWTFPGNSSDQKIIRTVKDDLGAWNLRRLVWVADAGSPPPPTAPT